MSEITLAIESNGQGHILARYDLSEIIEKAYQKGRIDKEKELAENNVFFSNRTIEDIALEARTDTINEMVSNLIRNSRTEIIDGKVKLIVTEDRIRLIAEEMKKKSNGI